jgi:hypothetical protein
MHVPTRQRRRRPRRRSRPITSSGPVTRCRPSSPWYHATMRIARSPTASSPKTRRNTTAGHSRWSERRPTTSRQSHAHARYATAHCTSLRSRSRRSGPVWGVPSLTGFSCQSAHASPRPSHDEVQLSVQAATSFPKVGGRERAEQPWRSCLGNRPTLGHWLLPLAGSGVHEHGRMEGSRGVDRHLQP